MPDFTVFKGDRTVLQPHQRTFHKSDVFFAVALTEADLKETAIFFFPSLREAEQCKAMGVAGRCTATIFHRALASTATETTKTSIGVVIGELTILGALHLGRL